MSVGSRDSYLKSLPAVGPFLDRVARYRLKGFHREERNGDGNELDVVATYPILPPWGLGTPKWTRDATANDSDKSFTVPAGKIWMLEDVFVIFVSTAVVGNRSLMLWVYDASGNLLDIVNANASQTANTTWYYSFYPGANVDTTGVYLSMPMPMLCMTAGMYIRVYDQAAIDAAADDLTVALHYVEYDAP